MNTPRIVAQIDKAAELYEKEGYEAAVAYSGRCTPEVRPIVNAAIGCILKGRAIQLEASFAAVSRQLASDPGLGSVKGA